MLFADYLLVASPSQRRSRLSRSVPSPFPSELCRFESSPLQSAPSHIFSWLLFALPCRAIPCLFGALRLRWPRFHSVCHHCVAMPFPSSSYSSWHVNAISHRSSTVRCLVGSDQSRARLFHIWSDQGPSQHLKAISIQRRLRRAVPFRFRSIRRLPCFAISLLNRAVLYLALLLPFSSAP